MNLRQRLTHLSAKAGGQRVRTLLLAGIMGVLGVIFLGRGVVGALFAKPLAERAATIAQLEKELGLKQAKIQQAQVQQDEMRRWMKLSLPPDPSQAQTLYQAYLIKLAGREGAGFSQPTVTPQSPLDQPGHWRLPFKIQARGQLENLIQLLYDFYRAEQLQVVRHMQITPGYRNGQSYIDIDLGVEAVALKDAPPSDRLPVDREGHLTSAKLGDRAREHYLAILERNPFDQRYFLGVQDRDAQPLDGARFIHLTAALSVGPRREVWFYDRLSNVQTKLSVGDDLNLGAVEGKVAKIEDRKLIVKSGSEFWSLDLGANLLARKTLSTDEAFWMGLTEEDGRQDTADTVADVLEEMEAAEAHTEGGSDASAPTEKTAVRP